MGIYGGIARADASVGPPLGGVLTEYLDWRWVMYVNVLIAATALGGAVRADVAATDFPPMLEILSAITGLAAEPGLPHRY
jgi:MFS family permease